ncbi:MAG: flotillin family protein [Okeania sp. SIO2G4]|uniref:SPFH domain-containing protein n=1 Tax=unclassified Okeania TaxID=2634635 RepID=UPI0013B96993|nr:MULTISPECIES: SPFH domain-containing protein [unclassified Okeania]NEP04215.1 flotillin family protein [Okeania sp. SIO4D6]NEP38368.1 flotillin family protein [Okeania sp. SIO2H7]NEP75057.1 flotillin family protein [Okeania sp. SIO2G5]NEP92194.1 flotillin family protein [Okeania sp. SIO2F5]NEQ90230.1 flotillin family protein [Okeania sp. SIO2G4]
MQSSRVSLKKVALIGLATIGIIFGTNNFQTRSLAVEPDLNVTSQPTRYDRSTALSPSLRLISLNKPLVLAQTGREGGGVIVWLVLLGGIIVTPVAIVTWQSRVFIRDGEIGIVYKKIAPRRGSLPQNKRIALKGETGWQPDVLCPGLHFRHPWFYKILKEKEIQIPPGEIGLVIAQDGESIPPGQMLGKVVNCDDFQDARAFLKHGQTGRQLGILRDTTYRINTKLFTVITTANATQHRMSPKDLRVCVIDSDKIGIVKTEDGIPLPEGEIAGSPIPDHDNFQNGQKFIDADGYKGLQEEVLPSGSWYLNPWFVKVEQVPLTDIPAGHVGVIISDVGKNPHTQDEPVDCGYKGVLKTPLYPGKYPINPKVQRVEIVPTHEITLDWSNKPKPASNYDSQLLALKLRSKDGFAFGMEVTQVISIAGKDAPKMLSRVGSLLVGVSNPTVARFDNSVNPMKFSSIKNLVTRVIGPMVGTHFRNSAQDYEALDFHHNRGDRQRDAIDFISSALDAYGVRAVGTFINEIDLPDGVEKELTRQKEFELIAETLKKEREAEEEKQKLAYTQALTELQGELVRSQHGVEIAELEAMAQKCKNLAKFDATKMENQAKIEFLQAMIDNLGRDGYLDLEKIKHFAELKLPEVLVNNSDQKNTGMLEALIASVFRSSSEQPLLNSSDHKKLLS